MLVETRKEFRKELEELMGAVVVQTMDAEVLGDENSLKTLASTARVMNLALTDMEEEAALLTEIDRKLDEVLRNQKKGS